MTLSVSQSATAVAANVSASFLGIGGTEPYLYSVVAGGAGGTIDPTTGVYTAPAAASSDPGLAYDTIQVDDYVGATATTQILVGTPLLLFCEIIQREMQLSAGRVYLWDQKIEQPRDKDLYVAVSVPTCKVIGNVNRVDASTGGMTAEQFAVMLARVDIDIISRGPEARDRKEEIILALNSVYARQQQDANSFWIGKISAAGGFINLSMVDGAAIPYRYRISVNMQYTFAKSKASPYYDDFSDADVTIDD